ncbi:MAG: glucosamine-6-phosphate deaminase [Bacteroidota bacterium]|nr:glucosamine-6-phosphate deaminase [Bacteroidota bacterium]
MDLSKKLVSPNKLFAGATYYLPKNMAHSDIITKYEKIPTLIFNDASDAYKDVAQEIAALIKEKQAKGEACVLGLSSGTTPVGLYKELIRLHKEEGVSFKNVVAFTLDEFYKMDIKSQQSYTEFILQNLIEQVDIDPDKFFFPDSSLPIEEMHEACKAYEQKIESYGGIDLQLLGVSRNGVIGFNEPGSSFYSRTRVIVLDTQTRSQSASKFNGLQNVPRRGITMGIQTILKAKKIILLAIGEHKAPIINATVEGDITDKNPASFLQNHPNVKVVVDSYAAMNLIRVKTPWLVDTCDWTNEQLVCKAAVWLCQKTGKTILKLTDKDYNDNGLSDLIAQEGAAYKLNIRVFNELQHTITGWPGGKPNADDTYRPERKDPAQKRVVVFSPHPDDDVISMGGTLLRLVEQGHEVHMGYEVSGNYAVADDYVSRFLLFLDECTQEYDKENPKHADYIKKIRDFLSAKQQGEHDIIELRKMKSLIRRMEAKAAVKYLGVKEQNIHFLNLPFYETGTEQKMPIGEKDVEIIYNLLKDLKPQQIFAAGDLSDPHGTHRVCLDAVLYALEMLKDEEWMKDCWVWLYRGAWAEWDIDQIEMCVPISPEELMRKREAILRHGSQKEGAMFLGEDVREFWQRAEDRNHATADLYDSLGMAEYEAMEAFVKYWP